MLTNKPPISVCRTLEQHLCCQYGRDTSSAWGSARVLCLAGGALGAALTVGLHPWPHLPVLSTSTSSQVSPSLEKVLCPTLSSWCLCKNPLPLACGKRASSDSSVDVGLKSLSCPFWIRAAQYCIFQSLATLSFLAFRS